MAECGTCGAAFEKHPRRSVDLCDGDACYPLWRQAYTFFHTLKYRSRKAGRPFDLTVEWIYAQLRTGVCARTGAQLRLLHSSKNMADRSPYAPSFDQVRPAAGYTTDNVELVCWWYNAAKQQFTQEEVLTLCQKLLSFSTRRVPTAAPPTTSPGTPTTARGASDAADMRSPPPPHRVRRSLRGMPA